MQNYILIQDGKKKIFEIPKEDVHRYNLIGSAGGFSFAFCMYLGWKHSNNFLERVYGYRIEEHGIGEMMSQAAQQAGLPKDKRQYIAVSFYEEKIH